MQFLNSNIIFVFFFKKKMIAYILTERKSFLTSFYLRVNKLQKKVFLVRTGPMCIGKQPKEEEQDDKKVKKMYFL